jgi:PAT family beta-lactamase induction signal transducer AmpG
VCSSELRLPLPGLTRALGRRRAWLLAAQGMAAIGLIGMALTDPAYHLRGLVALALLTAFSSATQDIALDAYRIESAEANLQAALAAAYQTGYRIGMIWAGAGALAIAARFDSGEANYSFAAWTAAYLTMAASMAVGVVTTLLAPEPAARMTAAALAEEQAAAARFAARSGAPRLARLLAWLHGAVVGPFADFVRRYRWHAVLLLALISTYRISDLVMGVMSNPFYKDIGFTKDQVAAVSKIYGVVMTLAGAFIGGVISLRIGVMKTLFLGATLSPLSILLFAYLSTQGPDMRLLVLAISADNLSAGIASSAFIAYLSGLTNVAYSATQYALFSSTMLLLPKSLAGFSGWVVDTHGYTYFFIGAAALGLPVLLLVALAARVHARKT